MRQGMEIGLTVPRILMEKVIPQLEAQLVGRPEDSGFYQPVRNMPESFSTQDRERLTRAYTTAIAEQLIPAYRDMRDFIREDYLAAARDTHGMNALPGVPGHHFQVALTLELTDLLRFRQFGSATAYSEGWGLYAESLGQELGAYTDPYQYFGKLSAELALGDDFDIREFHAQVLATGRVPLTVLEAQIDRWIVRTDPAR